MLLDVAQVSYNLQRSEATGKSPFELAIGQQPPTPHMLAISFTNGRRSEAAKLAKSHFGACAKGLVQKYEGPYLIVAKICKVYYCLNLPSALKIHPVFHASMLTSHQEDEKDLRRVTPSTSSGDQVLQQGEWGGVITQGHKAMGC
ncbi:hypothetical protein BUALT_Bualt16G0043100 [Buddleja alternifolia]|uniref:Tf2-1-like SH3-like domain-containing protein n=1 Tax=Buddleja alternifolia TaxID=168488 RepID=A0AAV6W963_9LAMI|nr:hypothetical protein BUALT_Bualt16G0043100 [Buddleja alternifolia]